MQCDSDPDANGRTLPAIVHLCLPRVLGHSASVVQRLWEVIRKNTGLFWRGATVFGFGRTPVRGVLKVHRVVSVVENQLRGRWIKTETEERFADASSIERERSMCEWSSALSLSGSFGDLVRGADTTVAVDVEQAVGCSACPLPHRK